MMPMPVLPRHPLNTPQTRFYQDMPRQSDVCALSEKTGGVGLADVMMRQLFSAAIGRAAAARWIALRLACRDESAVSERGRNLQVSTIRFTGSPASGFFPATWLQVRAFKRSGRWPLPNTTGRSSCQEWQAPARPFSQRRNIREHLRCASTRRPAASATARANHDFAALL